VKAAKARAQWARAIIAYTLGGAVSSAVIGWVLSTAGAIIPRAVTPVATPVLIGFLVIAVLRDTGLVRLPMVEACRQTRARFGTRVEPLLWGLDLGLFFTTHLTLMGVWLLPVAAVLAVDPVPATALFVAYWLGRAMPTMLVGPLLLRGANGTAQLLATVSVHGPALRMVHASALASGALLVLLR
jgi:hypothetical protein